MKYSALDMSMAGDKYLGTPYSEMDCQAFVERCMKDVGYNRNMPGSNAWYRAMTWTGSPEDCVRTFGSVPKGALLFILEHDGKEPAKYRGDGIGNASHVGMKTGRNDGAIHSSHSRGCVCTSKFNDKTIPNGGWNRVGLLDVFDYGKTVNWVLEHGGSGSAPADGGDTENNGGEKPMQGRVSVPDGTTVNLRKKPDGALIDRIPDGTELEILKNQGEWCRVSVAGLVGWMMSKFIQRMGADDDDEPVADDSGIPDEDFGESDLNDGEADPEDARELLAKVYDTLKQLCDSIEKAIGRG